MCIFCIIEGFLEICKILDVLEMDTPYDEDEERRLFRAVSRSSDSVVLTNKDGQQEKVYF